MPGETHNDNVIRVEEARAKLSPGCYLLDGTDLELVLDRRGDDLVLNLNKSGALVYRTLLLDVCKGMTEQQPALAVNPFAPDQVFTGL